MMRAAIRPFCRHVVTAGFAAFTLLSSQTAGAQTVDLTFTGAFTGISDGNAGLRSAIGPLLGTGPFSVGLTLDRSAAVAPSIGVGTLYRAIANGSSSFSGFTSTNEGCTSISEFICTVRVVNRTGVFGGTGSDEVSLLSDLGQSAGLQQGVQAAGGGTRQLSFQFAFFYTDIAGSTLGNESLGFDFTALNPDRFTGELIVFAPAAAGGFDRAGFDVRLSSIRPSTVVPEPSSYALLAVGLAGIGIAARRQRRAAVSFCQG